MVIDTIIFDFDGTLADTNQLISNAFLTVLETYYPGKYALKDVIAFNGFPLDDIYTKINIDLKEEMITAHRSYVSSNHDSLIAPFPGVLAGLKQLKELGFKLIVVSMKSMEMIERGIVQLGMEDLFDAVVGKEMTVLHKPNPEPLYYAVNMVNSEIQKSLIVGDSSQDIQAGKNAGIPAILVGWTEKNMQEMKQYAPDLIINDMKDLIAYVQKSGDILREEE